MREIQAVLLAGDRGASKAVRGASKGFVHVAGKPMVVHVLEALLHTPEVCEIFAVGDAIKLEKAVSEYGVLDLASARGCPVHIVPQRSSLYENVWHGFLRTLPAGREPDPDHEILVVPTDIPLVVPEELSQFIARARAREAGYVVGLSPESAMLPFAPREGTPGIEMACFQLREGRFRQNNLHLVRPLRMGNRHYIQDIYENRYQKQLGKVLALAWRVIRKEYRNLWVLGFYALMHLGSVLDRRGHRRAADRVRAWVSLPTVERGISALLKTRFTSVSTELGGAALDVDNDADLDAADKMLERWKAEQIRLARQAMLGGGD